MACAQRLSRRHLQTDPRLWILFCALILPIGCHNDEGASTPFMEEPPTETVEEASLPTTSRTPPASCEEQNAKGGCFIQVPSGSFLMGAQSDDVQAPGYFYSAKPNEGPVRKVYLDTYWIQRTEVSAEQFKACLDGGGCHLKDVAESGGYSNHGDPTRARHPINSITWFGARDYCGWIGARLPSEAEWEKAAKGETNRLFPWGNELHCPLGRRIASRAYQADRPEYRRLYFLITNAQKNLATSAPPVLEAITSLSPLPTQETAQVLLALGELIMTLRVYGGLTRPGYARGVVDLAMVLREHWMNRLCLNAGTFDVAGHPDDVSPFGAVGMAGNVWEWVHDIYAADYYQEGSTQNPAGPIHGEQRIQRGGGWSNTDPLALRTTTRGRMNPNARLDDVGFRCAWSASTRETP